MALPQLITIFSSFDSKEWESCRLYLQGLLLKDSKELNLFRYLNSHRQLCASQAWELERVHVETYPNLKRKSFQNLIYRLESRVEGYIIQSELNRSKHLFEKRKMLLSYYHRKSLFDLYKKELKELRSDLEDDGILDLSTPLKELYLHHLSYFSELPFEVHRNENHLIEGRNSLENYYQIMASLYDAELLSIREKHGSIKIVESRTEKNNDLVEIFYQLRALSQSKEESSFYFLLSQLIERHNNLSTEVKKIILVYLINYCYYDTKHNKRIRHQELSELFHFGLSTKLLLEDGKMGVPRFLNMVEVFSKHGQNSIKIIKEIWPMVSSEGSEDVYHLSYAIWYCSKERYEEALEELRIVNISRFKYSLARRAYWVKLCCLGSIQNNHQNMREVLHAARVFFNRQKPRISERDYMGSINLIQIISMIINAKPKGKIHKFIHECEYLVCLDWIHKRMKKYDPQQ